MAESIINLPSFHPKQQMAYDSEANDQLLGGATRGGKSFYVRKALILWSASIPGLQSDIFRLNFDDVIAENMDGETSFPVLLDQWVKDGLCKINQTEVTFWNKSKISLEHCANDNVMAKHQGIPKHVRVFSEATQIPERRIKWLCTWVTMSEEMKERVPEKWKGRFPRVIYTSNPIGVSAGYFRRTYTKGHEPGSIWEAGEFKRQYIPFLPEDNPSESAAATRRRVGENMDKAIADALLNANWNAQSGEFFQEWDEARHVVTDFEMPGHWFKFKTFDYGSTDPFVIYLVGISDGEPFNDEYGKERWFPRGALIYNKEDYGASESDPSKGIRLSNEEVADRVAALGHGLITLTDSLPFMNLGGFSIADVFQKRGVILTKGDTSRIPGWTQFRSRLIGKEISPGRKVPMIFFCENCKAARDYIPALTRHKSEGKTEDATEHGEATHSCDAIRLGCMAHSHNLIRDYLAPIEVRIAKEIQRHNKPTMKGILSGMGQRLL